MDVPSTRRKNPRTTKIKAAKDLKNAPVGLLLQKKAECDAKALKIVERMLEPQVKVDWMLEKLSQINKSHMEDIAEERSIVKLCGYVLCDNPLTKKVTKQYQISTLRNKVYDISRVKNYCSYSCYRAAEYLVEQMLVSPLWLRDQEEIPKFHILPEKDKITRGKSPPGVEVDLTGIQLPEDPDDFEESLENLKKGKERRKPRENSPSKDEPRLVESGNEKSEINVSKKIEDSPLNIEATISGEHEKTVSQNTCDQYQALNEELSNVALAEKAETSVPVPEDTIKPAGSSAGIAGKVPSVPVCKSSGRRRTEERRPRKSRERVISYEKIMSRVEKSFREWFSEKTRIFLHGDVAEKQDIIESVKREDKYAALCKKLNHLELEEERDGNERSSPLKPPPDFAALQEEARGMELKVRAFWEGKTELEGEAGPVDNSSKQEENVAETVLPLIDLHAPNALRRRIFLDKLNKVLPDLLRTLAGSGQAALQQYSYTPERCATVKALVSTFRLSATNITFKTAEWTVVALIIIRLLGLIDPRMKYLMGSERARLYIPMILMSYQLESNYLENFVSSITSEPSERVIEDTRKLDTQVEEGTIVLG